MRITIATPLYPPDIAPQASYVKELASRLSSTNQVTILAYGHIPEEVPGVTIVNVEKRAPLIVRLARYTWKLVRAARTSDVVYVQNGASVELPTLIAHTFTNVAYFCALSDEGACRNAREQTMYGWLNTAVARRAKKVVETFPPERPEIFPLEEYPTEAFATWESVWKDHLKTLCTYFNHA